MTERVAIVGGARTPFAKANTALKDHRALELGTAAVDGALAKTGVDPERVEHLVFGIVGLDARIPHLAREVAFSSVLPASVRALTVVDNCITSVSAIESVVDAIGAGRAAVGIAGGVESMSNPSVLWSRNATRVLADLQGARTFGDRLKTMTRFRPSDLKPQPPGVTEPSTGLSMGEHTEITVKEWKISRSEQDEIAYRSHMNAAAAAEDGRLGEGIVAVGDVGADTMIRPTTSMEKLAKLPPVFDRSEAGTLTAGNSSPLTDGAAATVLVAEGAAQDVGVDPLAYVKGIEFAAIDPADGLLMAPAVAVPRLLRRLGLDLADIDLIEIHEAFGGQVAANLAAWEHGWKEDPIGKVDRDKLNVMGGSIAIGHPFAATGSRIVNQLAAEMTRRGSRYGLISICGAGATAAAMVLER